MTIGRVTIIGSLNFAEKMVATADSDCAPGEVARLAVGRCGGSFDVDPVRRWIRRAAGSLGYQVPGLSDPYNILNDLDRRQTRRLFGEMRRLINIQGGNRRAR